MKTALVTGATGFIGGHVVRALVAAGWRVHATRRVTSDTSGLKEAAAAVMFHDTDRDSAEDLFASGPFDAVVLLAASYGRGNELPSTTLATNVQFPLEVLERAVDAYEREREGLAIDRFISVLENASEEERRQMEAIAAAWVRQSD